MSRKRNGDLLRACTRLQVHFGKRLHESRREQQTKQAKLAVALGLSRTSISNIERGKHRIFLDQVYEAARALGVEPGRLLPTLAEIYPPQLVMTAADDPLSAKDSEAAVAVTAKVRAELTTNSKRRR